MYEQYILQLPYDFVKSVTYNKIIQEWPSEPRKFR